MLAVRDWIAAVAIAVTRCCMVREIKYCDTRTVQTLGNRRRARLTSADGRVSEVDEGIKNSGGGEKETAYVSRTTFTMSDLEFLMVPP